MKKTNYSLPITLNERAYTYVQNHDNNEYTGLAKFFQLIKGLCLKTFYNSRMDLSLIHSSDHYQKTNYQHLFKILIFH